MTTEPSDQNRSGVTPDLVAVLVAITAAEPRVLTVQEGAPLAGLPSGPLETTHRSLQAGVRDWVEKQTRHPLGYLEQLYTFADRGRHREGVYAVSISYLGLTREGGAAGEYEAGWRNWYRFFPWEDHRDGPPELLEEIAPPLAAWAGTDAARRERVAITFGIDGVWNEELILQRYELLFEAGLVAERGGALPGEAMIADHRRILATAIARLRAKIKYRPVVFELMPAAFTLLQLQKSVEAIAGRRLHKPNFRRLIEQQALVEETGESSTETGGRPAKLFRFRGDVRAERAVVGSTLPLARS